MSSVGTSSSSSSSGSLFSMSGLISGLDWDTLIKQLVAVERQPETKLSQKISTLTAQKTAIKELKTQLTTLRSRLQDFRFNNIFDSYSSTTSEDTVLTSSVSGTSAAVGSYVVKVTQLASATVANSDAAMSVFGERCGSTEFQRIDHHGRGRAPLPLTAWPSPWTPPRTV